VVKAPGVLTGDTGEAPLQARLVSGSAHGGKLSLSPNGAFTYKAKPGFSGKDKFTYEARDPDGGTSAPATVTLTVISKARLAQIIHDLEQNLGRILASYHAIAGTTQKILAGLTSPGKAGRAHQLVTKADKLAKTALALEKQAKREHVSLSALHHLNAANEDAASARRLIAEARKLAAAARAGG